MSDTLLKAALHDQHLWGIEKASRKVIKRVQRRREDRQWRKEEGIPRVVSVIGNTARS